MIINFNNLGGGEGGGGSHGGSGGYNVVDSLPATGSATEGALYYVKPYVEFLEYRGISITTTSSEGFVAHIYHGEGNEKPVYISGTDFHWGYQNDGEYHKKDDAEFWYKTDNANKTINVYLPDNSWTVTLEEGATSAETSPYTIQVSHDGTTYRFNGTGYTIDMGNDGIFYFGDNNFNRLMSLKENGVDLSQLIYIYDKSVGVFDRYDNINNEFIFKLSDITYNPVGTPLLEENRWLKVKENGTNFEGSSKRPLPMNVELNLSSSGLSIGLWVRTVVDNPEWPSNPIVLRAIDNQKGEIWTQNVWFRPYYNAESGTWESLTPSSGGLMIFGAEFYYRGKKIVAEWLVNGEGASTVMKWTETELSTADSTPPSS